MTDLTIQEIETIVHRDENRIMEAKQTTGELTAGMQSGCAFLNTDGGWLFFGIHPKKLTILGQDVADQTRQDIANTFRKFSPAIDLYAQYVEVPDKPGKFVIAIHFKAPKAFEAPYTFDGRPWYKVENTTAKMTREMFDERIRLSDPEKFSWEKTMLPGATDKDISNKRLVQIINAGINKGRIPPEAASLRSIDQRLDHFNLRTAEGYLTNAAVALFGKNPTRKISQCELKLARFEGTNMRVFRDQTVCEGNLFDQYDAILDFCKKHMFLAGNMDQKNASIRSPSLTRSSGKPHSTSSYTEYGGLTVTCSPSPFSTTVWSLPTPGLFLPAHHPRPSTKGQSPNPSTSSSVKSSSRAASWKPGAGASPTSSTSARRTAFPNRNSSWQTAMSI